MMEIIIMAMDAPQLARMKLQVALQQDSSNVIGDSAQSIAHVMKDKEIVILT